VKIAVVLRNDVVVLEILVCTNEGVAELRVSVSDDVSKLTDFVVDVVEVVRMLFEDADPVSVNVLLVGVIVIDLLEVDVAIVLVLDVAEFVAVPVCELVRVIVDDTVIVRVVVIALTVSDAVPVVTVLL